MVIGFIAAVGLTGLSWLGNQRVSHRLACALTALVAAGAWLVTPPASAQVPSEEVTTTEAVEEGLVFHHLQRYRPAIEILTEEGPPKLRRVEAALGLQDMPTIEVWVLPTVHDYYELHDRPASAPEWAVGLSFSGQHEIVVAHGGQRAPIEVMRTFAHELAHVAVDYARQDADVPRWFHEGFAVMMAQEWTAERSDRLARAAASEQLRSFEALWDSFPGHHQSASLAYDQSFHFVRWLQSEYGADLFSRVMRQVRQGDRFQVALETQTGTSFDEMEAHWRDSLGDSATFWSILRDDFTIFFGAAIFFIIVYIIVRRRRRRRFEEMEDEEPAGEWEYDASRYPLPGRDQPD